MARSPSYPCELLFGDEEEVRQDKGLGSIEEDEEGDGEARIQEEERELELGSR
jgi:hypothetical protein